VPCRAAVLGPPEVHILRVRALYRFGAARWRWRCSIGSDANVSDRRSPRPALPAWSSALAGRWPGHGAYKQGKAWGSALVDVLKRHGNGNRSIELLIEALVADGIRRGRKGGKGSRKTLSTAACGLLAGLAEYFDRGNA
jgi:hypothetical protein